MNKKFIVPATLALTGAVMLSGCGGINEQSATSTIKAPAPIETPTPPTESIPPKLDSVMGDATYTIEEEEVTLVNGKFQQPVAPGSASMETAELDNDTIAMGDLNDDGTDDYAGIVMYNGGGSGTFAYLVALVGDEGTNGVMIGDRVPVDSVVVDEQGVITVKTYERAEGEAMAETPSIAVTKTFALKDGILTEQK